MRNKCLDQWSSLLLPHSRCLIHFARCASSIWQPTVQRCCQKTCHVYSWSYAESLSLPRERVRGNPELLHQDNIQLCVAPACNFSQLRYWKKTWQPYLFVSICTIFMGLKTIKEYLCCFIYFPNVGFYVFKKHIPTL